MESFVLFEDKELEIVEDYSGDLIIKVKETLPSKEEEKFVLSITKYNVKLTDNFVVMNNPKDFRDTIRFPIIKDSILDEIRKCASKYWINNIHRINIYPDKDKIIKEIEN